MATLKAIARELLRQAKLQPCTTQVRHLDGGLWLGVRIDSPDDRQLKLERKGVAPSAEEWKTVLDHWPEPLPDPRPVPTKYKTGPRYALVGRWKSVQAELITERKSDG